MTVLHQYVIYDHPRDYPDSFVVRRWEISAGSALPGQPWTAPTLEAARGLVPSGLFRLERDSADDPAIAEIWM